MALAYAVDVAQGRAGICDPHYIGPYRERFVRWGEIRWLVTQQFLTDADRAQQAAEVLAHDEIGEYGERIVIWLRRLHRRSVRRPVLATAVSINWRPRRSQTPDKAWLVRHLSSQRRRTRQRDQAAETWAEMRNFVAALERLEGTK